MVAHVNTVAFHGIEARPVDVQVHIASGLPAFTMLLFFDRCPLTAMGLDAGINH